MSIYDKNGWLNINYLEGFDATIYIIVGERQIGKTFGVLKRLLYDKDDRHVMLVRRTTDEVETIAQNKELSPLESINRFTNRDFYINKVAKNVYSIDELIGKDERDKNMYKSHGICTSLSGISKMRGFDGSIFTDIVLDEFIPESHVRRLKNEGDAVKNMYATVSGNREINGKKPLKLWLLANSNNLSDVILESFGVTEKLEEMIKKQQTFYFNKDRNICIVMSNKSPISEKRKEGALYRALQGTDDTFLDMAYNAKFSYNDTSNIGKVKDVRQLEALCKSDGVCIYKYNEKLYITDKQHCVFKNFYGSGIDENRRFYKDYGILLDFYYSGNILFKNYALKNKFLTMLGRKPV